MTRQNRKRFPGMLVPPKVGAPKKRAHGWWKLNKEGRRKRLNERQKQVLYFIRDFQFEKRMSPTSSDVSEFFHMTKPSALNTLANLVEKGYIEIDGRWNAPQILFPKGVQFPWLDEKQFPEDIFDPREPFEYLFPPSLLYYDRDSIGSDLADDGASEGTSATTNH